jgi:putative MATE family efflux protein
VETITKQKDLTQGSVLKGLFLFSLPLLGSSVVQQLYNTVDLIFVGNLVGKEASAAIGSTSMLTVLFIGFFMGMGVGASVLTGHAFGARQDQKLKDTIHTTMGVSILATVAAMAIGLLGAPYFLKFMDVPLNVMPLSLTYLRIYFIGMFATVFYNMPTGIIRALGDSRSPLIYVIVGSITNIGLDALFIAVFHMGVAGAAVATVLSQALAAILTIRYLCRLPKKWRLEFKKINVDRVLAKRLLGLAVPEAIRSMLMTFSNLVIQTGVNSLGVESMAAYAGYGKIEGFIYLPQWAVGQANTTFVSQNLGAGNLKRAQKGTKAALAMAIGITLGISSLVCIFAHPIFRAFSSDHLVIDLSVRTARATYMLYFLYAIVEVLAGTIRGSGTTVSPMVITIVTLCGFRIVVLKAAMHYWHTLNQIIGFVFPMTWVVAAAVFAVYYFSGLWKRGKRFKETV